MTDTQPTSFQQAPRISADELVRAREQIARAVEFLQLKVVGQHRLTRSLLVTLLSGGHILLESVPGLAKTLAASTLAASVQASFARIQCTPDLLPSDIIGTQVFEQQTGRFSTQLGPVHNNFVLLDEINRSSAKTQAAMLEAMQEHQTSIGGETFRLPDPFMVLATQNPIEEEGTYVLPQAQMDRFLLKEVIDYPRPDEEVKVLGRVLSGAMDSRQVPPLSVQDVLELRALTQRVSVPAAVQQYAVSLVNATRSPESLLGNRTARHIEHGASPRGAIAFVLAGRAQALLAGRDHVLPEDLKQLRHQVLRHRVILTFEALAERVEVTDIIDQLFETVPIP